MVNKGTAVFISFVFLGLDTDVCDRSFAGQQVFEKIQDISMHAWLLRPDAGRNSGYVEFKW